MKKNNVEHSLKFAAVHLKKLIQHNIVWSDETKTGMDALTNKKHVWRRYGTAKFGGEKIRVLGFFNSYECHFNKRNDTLINVPWNI